MPSCPSPADLHGLLAESLDDKNRLALELHVESCTACQAVLDRLTASENGAGAATAPAARDDLPVPAEFAERLRQFSPFEPVADIRPETAEHETFRPDLPGFEIIDELGRGGMGVVYRAMQRGLNRVVAVKVLRHASSANAEELERFRLEAVALGRLRHPNIISIYEVGTHDGVPFFVMEYVAGGSLQQHLRGEPVPPRAAAALVEALAGALHAAHQAGLIHRDVKPANVLLSTGANGQNGAHALAALAETTTWLSATPKLTDFGLVKQLDASAGLTQSGQAIGTPHYIAPEALAGSPPTPAYDQYALGVLLYQLLTCRPPFQGTSALAILQQAVSHEATSPGRLSAGVPADLETICLKCLDKDPGRRYRTAGALADDLARYRRGEPIVARPVGTRERIQKWARRKPAVAGLLASLIAVGLTGLAGVLWEWRDAVAARLHSETMEGQAIVARDQAREAARVSRRQVAERNFDRGIALADEGRIDAGLHWILECLRETTDRDADLRRLARINLASWGPYRHRLRHFLPHSRSVTAGAFHPTRPLLVTGCTDQYARLWDLESGRLLVDPLGPHPGVVQLVAFSSDGTVLLTANGAQPHGAEAKTYEVRRWDAATGRALGSPTTVDGRSRFLIPIGPDGRQAVTLLHESVGGRVSLWDLDNGKRLATLEATSYPQSLAAAPDGRSVWGVPGNRWATVPTIFQADFQAQSWSRLQAESPEITGWVSRFANGGRTLHWYGETMQVRNALTSQPVTELFAEPDEIFDGLFLDDGRAVAVATGAGIFIHAVPTGQKLADFSPHGAGRFLALDPTGRLLAGIGQYSARHTVASDQFARVWELARPHSRLPPQADNPAPAGSRANLYSTARFSPDGRTLVLLGNSPDEAALFWDCASDQPIGVAGLGVARPPQISFNTTGSSLLAAGAQLATVATDSATLTGNWLRPGSAWLAAAWHPQGRRFALGTFGQDVIVADAADPLAARHVLPQSDWVYMVAFHPQGRLLAVGTQNERTDHSEVRLWDVETGQPVGRSPPFAEGRVELAYAPDGESLLATTSARTWLLKGDSAELISELFHVQGCTACAFSRDGRLLATTGGDGGLQLWDAQSGARWPHSTPMLHPRRVRATSVAINPDGATVLVGHADGTARLWDVATSRPLGPPVVQRHPILAVAFTADGQSFRTAARDGRSRTWPLPHPAAGEVPQITLELEIDTCMTLGDGQSLTMLPQSDWQERRDRLPGRRILTGRHSSDESPIDLLWHEACARDAEEEEDAVGGLWHLERLRNMRPDTPLLLVRQAALHLLAGRPEVALTLWNQATPQLSAPTRKAWCAWQVMENTRLQRQPAADWWKARLH